MTGRRIAERPERGEVKGGRKARKTEEGRKGTREGQQGDARQMKERWGEGFA